MTRWLILSLTLFALPATAEAQFRGGDRARMELAVDGGYGGGSEGDFVELATDFRAYAPSGTALVVRFGGAARILSAALAVDAGVAQRVDLHRDPRWGLQLVGAVGVSAAVGPFASEFDDFVGAFGGFAMAHVDLWFDTFFVGLGVSGHLLAPDADAQNSGRTSPIATVTPLLRVGGDWGL